jgi:hypothetical protein
MPRPAAEGGTLNRKAAGISPRRLGLRDLPRAIHHRAAFIGLLYLILGLPGRIAIARHHPEAEAVNMMGWLGFIAIVPWVQAFIWAFKPTDVVDLRYLRRETRPDTDEQIVRLTGKPGPEAASSQAPPPRGGPTTSTPAWTAHHRHLLHRCLAGFLPIQADQVSRPVGA